MGGFSFTTDFYNAKTGIPEEYLPRGRAVTVLETVLETRV